MNSPNNKKAGKVKYFYWFYNKHSNELFIREGEFNDENEGLLNNLNNGFKYWPGNVSSEGYLISGVPVQYLLEDYDLDTLKASFPFESFKKSEYIIAILK